MTIMTVGIDLAKNVFSLHGVDQNGKEVLRRCRRTSPRYCSCHARAARSVIENFERVSTRWPVDRRIDTGLKLLPVDLSRQLVPGTFEHALCHWLDHELDLRAMDKRFRNDDSGAPAYAPSVLLKVILFAYSRGIVSSRAIEQACRENVVFMALSGDSIPHFTTVAAFVRELKDEIANLFTQVLFLCDAQGLIGREMFAIDGVKLPSNASKAKSGTRAEFKRQADKIETQVKKMLDRHHAADERPLEPNLAEKESERIEMNDSMIKPSTKTNPIRCGTGIQRTRKTNCSVPKISIMTRRPRPASVRRESSCTRTAAGW